MTTEDFPAQVAEPVPAAVESNPPLRKATPVVAPARQRRRHQRRNRNPQEGQKTAKDFIREAREQRERDN